jgi:anti-sigma-K factor RskA
MNPRNAEELQALAGEYVIGVLSPDEAREVERLMRENPALDAAVHEWQDRLLPMASIPEPIAPSPALWQRIARDLPSGRSTSPTSPAREARPRLWDSVKFWRLAALAGFAAALLLAFLALLRPIAEPIPMYTAVLQSPHDRSAGWLVEGTRDGMVTLTPLVKTPVQPEKALQFWTKPDGAAGPSSLGLVKPDERIQVPADKLPGLAANQLFEITLEPAGGSPYNKPSGPILYVGRTVKLM